MESNISIFTQKINTLSNFDKKDANIELLETSKNFIFGYIDTDNKADNKALKRAVEIADIIMLETGGELKSTLAAMVHTALNHKNLDLDIYTENLDAELAQIILGSEKIRRLKVGKIKSNADNYIKLALTYSADVRSVLVRLSELVLTIRHINELSPDEQETIINLSSELYAPMAHRLGLYKIKTELEEAVMRHEAPDMYKFIAQKLKSSVSAREKYIENFIKPIKKKLDDAGLKYKVKGRTKAISSIWKKIQKQGVGFEKVKDIFAVRIILDSKPENEKRDCWNVYSIITDMYKPDAKRMRDWISSPRKSGYESLHATILGPGERWVEVQIRTTRMDEIAEKGPAAHWRYKEKGGKSQNTQWLAHMRDALEKPDLFSEEEEYHKNTQADEIFIFTPAGELKKLTKGYTILDFAFSIHSKLGETCTGGMVDGVFKPLSYVLKNGETVKINTSKSQTPNSEWLNFSKSPRARLKIKRTLKLNEFKHADLGKEMVKKKMEQLGIEFSEANVHKLTDFFNAKHPLHMYHMFGEGKLSLIKLKQAFETKPEENQTAPELENIPSELKEIVHKTNDFLLLDNNLSTLDYQLAKCCKPVPGDKVFGFVTVSKGTKIHKENCPNAADMKARFPYRILKAKWNIKTENRQNFIAEFFISGEDKNGITADLSMTIANELGLSLRSITLNAQKNNQFTGKIGIEVRNTSEIQRIIKILSQKKYIRNIKRS